MVTLISGLVKATADLIGWRSITITPDMVGTTVAIFASIEVKTPTGRVSPTATGLDGSGAGRWWHCWGCPLSMRRK
jgi:hypothetical protein